MQLQVKLVYDDCIKTAISWKKNDIFDRIFDKNVNLLMGIFQG